MLTTGDRCQEVMHCSCVFLAGKVGALPVEACCIIELPALQGRQKLGDTPLFVLVEKEGE